MTSNVWLKQVRYLKVKLVQHIIRQVEIFRVKKKIESYVNRSGMTINFNGIQMITEASMYYIYQANKYGFLILFCIISNHLNVVIVLIIRLIYIVNILNELWWFLPCVLIEQNVITMTKHNLLLNGIIFSKFKKIPLFSLWTN